MLGERLTDGLTHALYVGISDECEAFGVTITEQSFWHLVGDEQ
jgi:hypothetical protein